MSAFEHRRPSYRLVSNPLSRRSFLIETSSLMAAAAWSSRAFGAVLKTPKLGDYPFTLGVASGDPTPNGVVLWTRLAPKPLEGGGMPAEAIVVSWQVCDDEQMTKVVRKGTTVATPDWAHAVHVEVEGLEPDRWYWYQFQCGTETSPKGRTRTTPAADALCERARFGVASCQHWEAGYYTAYEHMLAEDVDLVFHLGDYIYEKGGDKGGVRQHVGPLLSALVDYRNRHAQYKTDPALQAMHAAAPWIVTWDDHETRNNYAADVPERDDQTRDEFLAMRANAYKAYYEHMPLRREALPNGPDMQLYRRVNYGRLAEFFVLDTRQYRSDQPCGDGGKPPCPESFDESRTMLGHGQRQWLFEGLASSPATWNVLAQQVMMARVDFDFGDKELYSMDQWPGYEADRRRVLRHLRDRKVANPVVLTGDIHCHWANELPADFDDPDAAPVAAEFVGTSITSGGRGDGGRLDIEKLKQHNPCVRFFDSQRGYLRCELTPRQWQTDYRVVDTVVEPGGKLQTPARFVLEAGSSKLNPA